MGTLLTFNGRKPAPLSLYIYFIFCKKQDAPAVHYQIRLFLRTINNKNINVRNCEKEAGHHSVIF